MRIQSVENNLKDFFMTKIISLRKQKSNKIKQRINTEKTFKKYIKMTEEKNKILLLLISMFGIFIGAICFRLAENSQLTQVVTENFKVLNNGIFQLIFLYLLKTDLIFFILSFFIGTSFIGSGISFITPMLKCLYIGYFSGYAYNEFELKGVLFCLLFLYPCFTITTTSLIFAANENIYMSKYIFKSLNGKTSTDNISIRLYLIRYLILLVINLVCIVTTAFLITFIGPKINII